MTRLRFGTLGAAAITPGALVQPVSQDDDVEISVVAARDQARANDFAERHGISRVADSYEDVVNDPEVNAIYVPLPVIHHEQWTLKALAAGKHVLCEKAFSANAVEARRMADAARDAGLVCMEAFHYRYHPVMRRMVDIVASGVLGEIRHVDGVFDIKVDPENGSGTYIDPALGGGSLMHMGCYPVSWLRHILGQTPALEAADAEIGPTGVDARLSGTVRYPGGATGSFRGSMIADQYHSHLRVEGSEGVVEADNPLVPHMGHSITLTLNGGEPVREVLDMRPSYSFQLDAFKAAIFGGQSLFTDAEDAVGQMALIDDAFRAAGIKPYGL